jgi:hypothetical protein
VHISGPKVGDSRLVGREELISRQLEISEAKFPEAVECAKESQVQVETLPLKMESCVSDGEALSAPFSDCQSEMHPGDRLNSIADYSLR